jgi:hypothetical protein
VVVAVGLLLGLRVVLVVVLGWLLVGLGLGVLLLLRLLQ